MSWYPTRREMMGALLAGGASAQQNAELRQASGVKIGEITPASAVIWTRRTASAQRLNNGIVRRGHAPNASAPTPEDDVGRFEGACAGGNGFIRLVVEPVTGRGRRRTFSWVDVQPARDFTHQFRVEGLDAATAYRFAVETREARGRRQDASLIGSFRTAPLRSSGVPVRFVLTSCQMYCRMDRSDGFWIYDAIERMKPDFLVSCGDNVYYDSEDPIVNSPAAARYHWARMYSLPTLDSCLRNVPAYWQKDDHDAYSDDCWPGMVNPKMTPFTFEQGQGLFREQTPAPPDGQPMYRRFRWGTALELWLPDSRDYRSPNPDADGPAKTIWGMAQKKWLEETLANSNARWKILVNPNPIVGPDHKRKRDNHANPAFATEGREFRQWLKANVPGSVILMNGDRHWQYHSVDPDTGVHEFGCGPASDVHAVPPSEGEDSRYHRFLRIKGGFVAVQVNPDDRQNPLVFEHRDVKGGVVHRHVFGTV
ncbi:MAG: alkaline phosphatase D family protein [Acidobacteria bacterium]|nr:alkaline phosphatase D family protein [Acidobacteriota bacterium]